MRHLLLSQVLHAHAAIETKIYKVCHIFSEPKARLLPPALFQGTRHAPVLECISWVATVSCA